MNLALELVHEVESVGRTIAVSGDKLKLRAPEPLPDDLVSELRLHKAEVLKLLSNIWTAEDLQTFFDERAGVLEHDHELPKPEAERRAWEWCIVEWFNRNPVSSAPGACAWCGEPENTKRIVVPFGTTTSTWLHHACWPHWQTQRRADAERALSKFINTRAG